MNIVCWQFSIGVVIGFALGGIIMTCIKFMKLNGKR